MIGSGRATYLLVWGLWHSALGCCCSHLCHECRGTRDVRSFEFGASSEAQTK